MSEDPKERILWGMLMKESVRLRQIVKNDIVYSISCLILLIGLSYAYVVFIIIPSPEDSKGAVACFGAILFVIDLAVIPALIWILSAAIITRKKDVHQSKDPKANDKGWREDTEQEKEER